MTTKSSEEYFNIRLAEECARAFAQSTGIGCCLSLKDGEMVGEYGYGCKSCRLCALAGKPPEQCAQSQTYGMKAAERFGGKYIYFCPLGMTCFVSPILSGEGSAAKITVGPFLMVEQEDYAECDLRELLRLDEGAVALVSQELARIPVIDPEKVTSLSTLLFLAAGFLNDVSESNRMLDLQDSDAIQGQITSYILQLKGAPPAAPYPFEQEKALLAAITQGKKQEVNKHLNEIFGHIFFVAAGSLSQAKARIYELFVLISRTAIDAGADPAEMLLLNQNYMQEIPAIGNIDTLCFWVTRAINKFTDNVFAFMESRHANVIYSTVSYLRAHCGERITLEGTAERMYLSPAYFSRLFKKETGENFNSYLNRVRIEKSKKLLFHPHLKLAEIAQLVGFEDQSYFTRVFKRVAGMTPLKYRESKIC